MGAKGAVEILFKKEIDSAENPQSKAAELEAMYNEQFCNPYAAAERGYIDDIVIPSETRKKLIKAFSLLANKKDHNPWKKHGNIPL
jgi:propionyl-CoA carboxylase beta chain